MAIRKIARMGHPVLRQVAAPIADPTDPEVARLARDLVDTCEDIGGNGIAAPQVHESVRMFVYRVRDTVMPPGARMAPIPWTVVVNPVLEPMGEEKKLYWERCLSLPDLCGQVPRYRTIRFRYSGLDGTVTEYVARGFHARLLQHEHDHLDGVLYPMRMADMSSLAYVSERGPAVYPAFPFDAEDFVEPAPR
ncbi:MAG: peptide deformylase [Ectothiorhodospiraceae bacterium]|nr:peptide deformylase [Ectothiorhodospiraceae bacterium]